MLSVVLPEDLCAAEMEYGLAPYRARQVSKRLFNAARKLHWTSLVDVMEHKREYGMAHVRVKDRTEG